MTSRRLSRVARHVAAAITLATLVSAGGDALAQQWTPRTPAGQPTAEQIAEARERYERGVQLYEVEGDVAGALIELKKAYDIAPNYRILFNIGQIARTARDYVTSLRALEAYLAQGGAEIEEAKRTQVSGEIETLRGLVANVNVTVDQPGATITIDDVDVGRSPLGGAIMVNAGRHRVAAQYEGRSVARSIEVGGRERVTVELTIPRPAAATPAPAQPSRPPEPESTGPSPYVWIGWGTAAALGAGAAVTGVLALSQKSDVEETTFVGDTPPEDLTDDRTTARTLGITSDVLTGTAIIVAGVSLYFTITTMDDAKPASTGAAVRKVAFGPGSIAVDGSF